VKGLGWVF